MSDGTTGVRPVRWGILGTARIARSSFLPALRQVPGAVPLGVASRHRDAAEAFARTEGLERAYGSYEALLDDPDIDAVYVPLPNHLHRPWTIRALDAGKAVFCEKPLGLNADEVREMVAASEANRRPLWEAFVFPFQPPFRRVLAELPRIGPVRVMQGRFTFVLDRTEDVRLVRDYGGGALYDVGCYPAHLARLLFDEEPVEAIATMEYGPTGVDIATDAVVRFRGGQRLHLSCGFNERFDTFCRIVGDAGEIRWENPYHQRAVETVEVRVGDVVETIRFESRVPSFQPALAHVTAVLQGTEAPEHLAVVDALWTARTLDLVRSASHA
jgi:xylose dehydrogenase (NAD/NADP)